MYLSHNMPYWCSDREGDAHRFEGLAANCHRVIFACFNCLQYILFYFELYDNQGCIFPQSGLYFCIFSSV